MRRTVFLAAVSCVCGLGVSAQQHGIDTQKSTLTIHVGKTGVFSALGHEHEVRAPIHNGTADAGAHPAVEVHVDARELRVIGKDEPEKDRLDHVIVFHENSLRRTLHSYFDYYHRSRTHLSLGKDSPEPQAIQPPEMGSVVGLPQVGGLHHRYERRAA